MSIQFPRSMTSEPTRDEEKINGLIEEICFSHEDYFQNSIDWCLEAEESNSFLESIPEEYLTILDEVGELGNLHDLVRLYRCYPLQLFRYLGKNHPEWFEKIKDRAETIFGKFQNDQPFGVNEMDDLFEW